MRKHSFRFGGVALALVAAVCVLLVVPVASADSPSGKDEVRFYTNSKGDNTQKVGEDELFNVVGKNLDHATDVFCWDPFDDVWVLVTDWSFGPVSKMLVDVDAAFECGGTSESRIGVEFSDGSFIAGPRLAIKAGDPDVLAV